MRITVVIPVKDDAAMLERCLTSLEVQSRTADQVIVVDNCSEDDSAEVARKHGAEVIRETRQGITAAASAGYDSASGDIIARCDADSVLPEAWLARIEDHFVRDPQAIAVTGPGRFYDMGPVGRALASVLYMRAYFVLGGAALAGVPLFGSNFAMRASAWRRVASSVPRDNPELHDDFDLSFRFAPRPGAVRYDGHLVVGISGRPFRSARAMGRRLSMGFSTIREHLPRENPFSRWQRRLEAPSRG